MKGKRLSREETRTRIMDQADGLFRQVGFMKTTVADIARELEMSTANIYKFFPSKNAIIEATAERRLGQIQVDLQRKAGAKKSASARLLDLVLSIYRTHRKDFKHERQIYQLVITATEENWACVRIFKEFLFQLISRLLDDGMKSGEFRRANPAAVTAVLLDCFTWITNSILFQELVPGEVEGRARAQVRFVQKALQ